MIQMDECKDNPKLNALIHRALVKDPQKKNRRAEMYADLHERVTPTPEKDIYIFDIIPIGKPRMTRRDKWAKYRTDRATMYFIWEAELQLLANQQNFVPGTGLQVIFLLPVKDNWSLVECAEHIGKPHQEKPDTDNLLKGFIDALCKRDEGIYDIHALKFWWHSGHIVVVRNQPVFKELLQIDAVYNALQREKSS